MAALVGLQGGGGHTEESEEASGERSEKNALVEDLTGHTLMGVSPVVSMPGEREPEAEGSLNNNTACCPTKIRGSSSGPRSGLEVPDNAAGEIVDTPPGQAVEFPSSATVVAEEGHSRTGRGTGRESEDPQQTENAHRFDVEARALRDPYTTPQSKGPGLAQRQLATGPPGKPLRLTLTPGGTPPGSPGRSPSPSPPTTPWGTPPTSPLFASPRGTPPGTPPFRPPPRALSLPPPPGPGHGPAEDFGRYLRAVGERFGRHHRGWPRFRWPGRGWWPQALELGLQFWRLTDGRPDPWWRPGPRGVPPHQEGVERLMRALQSIAQERGSGGGGGGPSLPPPPPPAPSQ